MIALLWTAVEHPAAAYAVAVVLTAVALLLGAVVTGSGLLLGAAALAPLWAAVVPAGAALDRRRLR